MIIECGYTDPSHEHSYPEDWIFGGADGLHPGADLRYQPTTYTYYDADLSELWVTQTPLCDDQALDEFTLVSSIKDSNPKWLSVKRPGQKAEMLPWTYDRITDMLTPRDRS